MTLTFDLAADAGRCPIHPYTNFEVRKPWHSEGMAHDVCVSINGPGDPELWALTLKLVCELHLRRGTFLPNLDTLGFWVLELFVM